MNGYRTVSIFLFILSFSGCSSSSRSNSFFFIQMADTQFGFFNDNDDFRKETINFEKAIGEANRLRPEFVVICGDLVNKPGDTAQINEYKRIASKLHPAIRLYNVAGNHDVGNVPTLTSLKTYRKNFGPDYYTFKARHLLCIVLNSSLMKDPDSAKREAAAQDLWLRGVLDKTSNSKKKLVVVFQHHSYFLADSEEKDEYFNFPRLKRGQYLRLFNERNVKYVFAGHYHRNAGGRSGDLEMITTGPVGRPLGPDPSGFRIVTVQGDAVNHHYYSLDSIPTRIR